ncbi:MAG: endonuclease/exonuclease/phosphatase family protein [Elusimicrobia bacterium]|nr:endonuclease/exonuclease/phosphatase family protein [Elusimicrobiota bacterium]
MLWPGPAGAARLLKALTYNVNGIPVVTSHWPQKRDAIGRRLREGGYDLVALQEAWRDQDALALAQASGLPYFTRYHRNLSMGTGLVILSRFPILETHEREFTCRPSALRWLTGESVANKGGLMVRVATPRGPLDVYTAHPVAAYADARYETLRWTQLYELAEMVSDLSKDRPFVLLGDLNTAPGEPAYGLLRDLLGLEDACLEKGKDVCGVTNAADGARIDHVLGPRGPGRFARAKTALQGFLPGTSVPYSDHLAVEADVDPRLLGRRLHPAAKERLAALAALETRIDAMLADMYRREGARSWLPIYGFLIMTRYEHQRRQLGAILGRVESARIRLLQGRP